MPTTQRKGKNVRSTSGCSGYASHAASGVELQTAGSGPRLILTGSHGNATVTASSMVGILQALFINMPGWMPVSSAAPLVGSSRLSLTLASGLLRTSRACELLASRLSYVTTTGAGQHESSTWPCTTTRATNDADPLKMMIVASSSMLFTQLLR